MLAKTDKNSVKLRLFRENFIREFIYGSY